MIEYVTRKVAELIPYKNNARINDEAVEKVAASIRDFGMNNPILIDAENVIIAGHTRRKALQKLGIEETPCVVVTGLSEAQVKAFRIADNSTAQLATWDLKVLQEELEHIDLQMENYGLEAQLAAIEERLNAELAASVQEDEVPPLDEKNEPICKLGEIWTLGRHRLMCGDSTKEKDVEELMGDEKADMLVTDPPYNIALGMNETVNEARKRHRRADGLVMLNDKMKDDEFYAFLLAFYKNANRSLKDGAAFYIWHADNEGLNFRLALKNAGLVVRQTLIWNKNAMTLGRQDYQWKHEPCLYGWKGGGAHRWYNDRSQTTILDFKKPTKNEDHPTMKPVELIAYQVRNSSKTGELVLDLFGGSGSTLVACEQLARRCYMMELDPRYCDVIIKRWENLTGGKAEKL